MDRGLVQTGVKENISCPHLGLNPELRPCSVNGGMVNDELQKILKEAIWYNVGSIPFY